MRCMSHFRSIVMVAALSSAALAAPRQPNVIFVLADDLGWAELGCYGNIFNETPNLDRLAKQGMRFTQAYAAAPVCSPFRASLMTGQWPARVGITDYLRPSDTKHLQTEHITLAEAFKAVGYATGMMGKWHLTGYKNHGAKEFPPTVHGFDEAICTENRGIGGGSYFYPYHFNRELKLKFKNPRIDGREYLVDRMNHEAVAFIERHKNEPFFLFKSHYAVHTRLVGRPDLVGKYSARKNAGKDQRSRKNNVHLAAQLELIDEGVGMIMEKLDELNLVDNTILIFMSDNGGEINVTSNAPLRAGKSTLYEGGIREPLIVRWPKTTPAGTTCVTPVCSVDIYPTLMDAIGRPAEKQRIDGVSFLSSLKDSDAKLERDALYWHYPLRRPHFLGGFSSGAIRVGDFKLIEHFTTKKLELFNLADDVGESKDLASSMPDKVAAMHAKLMKWRESVGAEVYGHTPSQKKPKRQKPSKRTALNLAGAKRGLDVYGAVEQKDEYRFDGKDDYLDLPRSAAPSLKGREIVVSATIRTTNRNGVVIAQGGDRSGFALYMKGGHAAASVCVDWKRTTVRAPEALGDAWHEVSMQLSKDGALTLSIDGTVVAKGRTAGPLTSDPGDSLQIGADTIKPVGDYKANNHFNGLIRKSIKLQVR